MTGTIDDRGGGRGVSVGNSSSPSFTRRMCVHAVTLYEITELHSGSLVSRIM